MQTEPGSRGPATQKKKYLKIKFLVIEFAFFQKNFRLKKLELRHYQSDVELTVGCENVWHKMRNVLHGDVQGLAMQDGGDEMTIVWAHVEVVAEQDLKSNRVKKNLLRTSIWSNHLNLTNSTT